MSQAPPEDEDPDTFYSEEELDGIWDNIDEDEQQEILDNYDEIDEWDDFNTEEKEGVLTGAGYLEEDDTEQGTNPGPDGTESTMVEGAPLALEEQLEMVTLDAQPEGEASSVSIAGIGIPGAYQYRRQGEGFESQYLREVEVGEEGNPYGADQDMSGGDGEGGDGEGGGEEPPQTFIIEARIGYSTLQRLRELRNRDETFDITVEQTNMEDMELVEVDTELTGENPYDLEAVIEVREWREYEVEDIGLGEDPYGQDSENGEGDPVELSDVPESGSPDEPNTITLDEGENRDISLGEGDRLRNTRIDASAPDSDAQITGDGNGWEIRDVGIEGADSGRPPVTAQAPNGGGGNIDGLFISGDDTVADGGGYDVIEASGQTIKINDGETWGDVLIDVSDSGFTIDARDATDWTIKNVGFEGYYEDGQFAIMCSDTSGGTSRIENVYLGDGCSKAGDGHDHGPGGIFVSPEHNGHIDIVRCNVQGFTNNGYYCSTGSGTVTIENCYGKNNGMSTFRVDDGDEIHNCTAYNDDTEYGWYHQEHDFGEEHSVPVLLWSDGTATIEHSHFDGDPRYTLATRRGGELEFITGGYTGTTDGEIDIGPAVSDDPDLTMPYGVPRDAQEAASGGPGADGREFPRPPSETVEPDHDVEVVERGEHLEVDVSSGEVLTNVMYNVVAADASVTIRAHGDDWTIRNVAVYGPQSGEGPTISCSTPTTATVENVYLGDGTAHHVANDEPSHGIYVDDDHTGTIDIERVYVAEAQNCAFDSSEAPGVVNYERCYSEDSRTAHYHVSGDSLLNCVAVNDGDDAGRCLWVRPDDEPTDVETCDFVGGDFEPVIEAGETAEETTVTMMNTQYTASRVVESGDVDWIDEGGNGRSPQAALPDGVPTDPVEAASAGLDQELNGMVADGGGDMDPGGGGGSSASSIPGIYVDPDGHRGNLTISNVCIRGMPGPGIQLDSSSEDAGLVLISDSYLSNNGGPAIQAGAPGGDDE